MYPVITIERGRKTSMMVFVGKKGMTFSCRPLVGGFVWDVKKTPRALLDAARQSSRGMRDSETPTTNFVLKEVGLAGSFVVADNEWVKFYLWSVGFVSPHLPPDNEFHILIRATELEKLTEFVRRYWQDD